MNLNGKKIVITGGAGFIGSALAHYFDENYKDAHVLVVDKFRNDETFSNGNLKSFGHFKNLLGFKGEIYAGDINNPSTLEKIKSFRPDVIYHEAAISDTTVKEQDELIKTNVNAFVNLLDICESLGAKMIYTHPAELFFVSLKVSFSNKKLSAPIAFKSLFSEYSRKISLTRKSGFSLGNSALFKISSSNFKSS